MVPKHPWELKSVLILFFSFFCNAKSSNSDLDRLIVGVYRIRDQFSDLMPLQVPPIVADTEDLGIVFVLRYTRNLS